MNNTIRMVGPPRRIYSLRPLEAKPQHLKLVSKKTINTFCANQELPCRYRQARGGGPLDLKLRLPPDTEPGEYPAELIADSRHYDVLIDVKENPKLGVFPKSVKVSGKPGASIQVELVLQNKGNVPITIPPSAIANLYRLQEIPAAIASTLQFDSEEPQALIDNLILGLKQGFGGIMKFRFDTGSSRLLVNQQKAFNLKARVPKLAKTGAIYTGIMHIESFHVVFEVTVL